MKLCLFAAAAIAGCCLAAPAAQAQEKISISVNADRPDAVYHCGEQAKFLITAMQGNEPITKGDVKVKLSLDGGRTIRDETVALAAEPVAVSGTLEEPGFLHCKVTLSLDGKTYEDNAGAAFDPESIQPSGTEPADFDEFWAEGRAELAKIPMDVQLTPLPDMSNDTQDTSKISFANIGATRIYGFLSVPKNQKPPFPAFVNVPGAGVGAPYTTYPEQATAGALTLVMGVHTHDLRLSGEEYAKLRDGELKDYQRSGAPDREKYFYRRAILGIDRAVQYLKSRPDWNGKDMLYFGQSQGGGVGLALVALNPEFTAAAISVPALCDHAGARVGRKPGWPQLAPDASAENYEDCIKMASYFDGVNFAKRVRCPVIMSVGFIDPVCPPSSVYAAYNVITAPKQMFAGVHEGHTMPKPFLEFFDPWMDSHLGRGDPIPPMAE